MTEAEFETHWGEIYPKVYGYYFKRIEHREDAEDLTLTSLSKYFASVKNPQAGNHYGLLWTIVRNNLIDFYRKSKNSQNSKIISTENDENFATTTDSYWDNYHSKNYDQAVERILECIKNHCKPEDFDLVRKIYLQQEDTQEAAKKLAISYQALRKRLSRIMQHLRKQCKQLWPSIN